MRGGKRAHVTNAHLKLALYEGRFPSAKEKRAAGRGRPLYLVRERGVQRSDEPVEHPPVDRLRQGVARVRRLIDGEGGAHFLVVGFDCSVSQRLEQAIERTAEKLRERERTDATVLSPTPCDKRLYKQALQARPEETRGYTRHQRIRRHRCGCCEHLDEATNREWTLWPQKKVDNLCVSFVNQDTSHIKNKPKSNALEQGFATF